MYRILYVDDEPGLLEIGKLFLERGGQFSVDTITSAPAALAFMKANTYDAIISDYQMPDMDGIVFLKRVRTSGNTIPFILFTGRGREEVVIQALNEGADFYLQKGGEPVSQFTELAHQVRQAIQQKRAEASIRDHERREADIINFLPDATFAIDRSGTIIAWNRAIEEMTGVTAAEMLGKGNYEYAIPFYGERQPILIDLIYEPDEVITREYAHIVHDKDILIADTIHPHPKGKPITLLGKASPLYNRQGEVVGAIESIRDITERKRAEDAIRESEEKFRRIFDTINDGIQINEIDPDGKPGKFLDLNIVAARMTQYTREELLELGPLDFVTGYHSRPLDTILGELTSDGHSIFETEYRRKDGTVLPVEINVHVVSLLGKRVAISVVRDITERRRADDAIRESEQRYRNVVEDQTEFISRFLPDGTHVFVNEAYCRYFGLKRDEMLGHRFRPQIPAEDRERVQAFFASLTPDHPVDSIEHRIVMPDGRVRWQRWSDRAIFDPSGTLTEYQSVGRDITEQKQEEQALHENEQRLTSIYNTVGDVIFQLAVEPHGQYRFASVNSAFSRITGLPPGRVIGRTVNEIIPEPSLDMVLEKYRQAIVEKAIVRWEETTDYPSGQVTGEVSIAPIFDRAGSCTHLIGSVHDITERKRAGEAVRESEERFRLLFTIGKDAIAVHKMGKDGQPTHFIQVNDIACERLGYTREEMLRLSPQDIDAPDRSGQMPAIIEKLLKTNHVLFETEQVAKDGHRIPVEISTVLFQLDGSPAAMSVARDITERKQAEAGLKESEVRFRTIFESQQNGLIMVDAETRVIVDANRTALSLFGATSEDVIGRVCHTFICPAEEGKCPVMDLGQAVDMSERVLLNIKGERIPVIKSVSRVTLGGRTYLIESFTDVTERKRAEEAVRESEAQLRQIIDLVPHMIFAKDWDGNYLLANKAVAEGYDTTVSGIVGKSQALFHKDTDELRHMLEDDREVMAKGTAKFIPEEPYIDASGKRRYLQTTKVPFTTPGNNQKAVLGVAIDITERKRAEEELVRKNEALNASYEEIAATGEELRLNLDELTRQERALRESEERYRRLISNSFDAVLMHQDGRILLANDAAARIIGAAPAAGLIGKPVLDFVCPEFQAKVAERVRQMSQSPEGTAPLIEEKFVRSDGTAVDVEVMATATEAGGRPAVMVVFRDIGERKRSEGALRESEAKFRSLVEYALEGILILDVTGKILFCNDAAARLAEADDCDGLMGRNVMEFIAPESREEVARDFTQVSQGHDAYLARYNVISQKGKKISVESIGKLISFEGRPAELISLRDITDRQSAETALREASRKLNILNNITRHDIRNSLFSLDVYLLELRKSVTDPELLNYLGKSIDAVKAVTHQIEFTKEYQSLGAQTAQWQKIGPLLPHKPAVAIRVAPEVADLAIFADPMLRKVFNNLYDNALRHGERVTEIRVRCDKTPGGLTLVWEDDGVGIPRSEKERIFERGFGKHTGLGLFLVREILGITGITIRETGSPGHGARFEMTVPEDRYRIRGEEH
jgi:PAS domain S-box-containing protein